MLSEAFAYQSLESVALYCALVHRTRDCHSQPRMIQLIESGQNLETGVGSNTGLFKDCAKGPLLGQAMLLRKAHSGGTAWAAVLPGSTRQTTTALITSGMNTGPECRPGFDVPDLAMPDLVIPNFSPNWLALYWPERKALGSGAQTKQYFQALRRLRPLARRAARMARPARVDMRARKP